MIVLVHKCRPANHPAPITAWLIMLFQGMVPWKKESFSHLAISYFSTTHNHKFADSTAKGVRDMRSKYFKKTYKIVETKRLNIPQDYDQFLMWFEEHEGKSYDKKQIVGLLLKALGLITFNKYGHNLNKLTCNELVLDLILWAFKRSVKDTDNYDLLMTWDEVLNVTDQT